MIRLFILIMLLSTSIISGCSTASKRVYPGEKGVHKVIATAEDRDESAEAGLDAASDYCEEIGKRAVFLKNKTTYTGEMEEDARKTVKRASNVAWMLGAPEVSMAGHEMTSGKDYKTVIKFKCR